MSLPPRSVGLIVFESLTSASLVLCAFLGNSILLIALCTKPRLRSSTGIMIAALAVTDLLNACIPGSLFFSSLVTGKMSFSSFGCQISGFFMHFLTYASMSTMALSAVNRFFCVLKPTLYKRAFTYHLSLVYVVSLWLLVAAVVFLPIVSGWSMFDFNPMMAACVMKFVDSKAEIGYSCFIVAFFVVFCLSIITFCYFRVSRFIQQHNYNSVLPPVQEIRLTRALFVLVFTFAGLWIPTFLAIVSFRLLLRSFISRELVLLVPYLVNLSSALNPWIYGVMSPLVGDKIKKRLFSKPRLPQSDATSLAGEITIVRAWQHKQTPREPHHSGEMLPNASF